MTAANFAFPDHLNGALVDVTELLAELGELGSTRAGKPVTARTWLKQQSGDNRTYLRAVVDRFSSAMASNPPLELHQEVRATVGAEILRQMVAKYL